MTLRATYVLPLILSATFTPGVTAEDEAELASLLTRLSRIASVYRNTALEFACEETIEWRGKDFWHGPGMRRRGSLSGRQKFAYVFVRDEIEGFRNFRTMTGWMPTTSRWTETHPSAPIYLNDALLWIFVFREERQPFHRYRIGGEERVLGRNAVQIDFEPIPPIRYNVNDWHGTAWVDRETAELLKVEAYQPEDYEIRVELQRLLSESERSRDSYYFRRHLTEYAVEKNGLRFPSRVTIEGFRVRTRGRREGLRLEQTRLRRVDQTYRDYKFFSVRAEHEIQAIIAGDR